MPPSSPVIGPFGPFRAKAWAQWTREGWATEKVENLRELFFGSFGKKLSSIRKIKPSKFLSKKALEERLNLGGGVRTAPRHPLNLWENKRWIAHSRISGADHFRGEAIQ